MCLGVVWCVWVWFFILLGIICFYGSVEVFGLGLWVVEVLLLVLEFGFGLLGKVFLCGGGGDGDSGFFGMIF